ncbi:hypothetical protein [Amycolatopsis acididurans]|uniref:hypothetical protein n=1 Tax=Amycolatopsis acididurans TaxID=2724524 RepID=UPI001FE6DF1D|nr:hypothetical protein [Amycolatopsis acididurans]
MGAASFDRRTVIGPTAHLARSRPLRHRVVVAGASLADVLRSAGGWLFDEAMDGSDVMVLVPGGADLLPLRILGARGGDLAAALSSPVRGPRPHSLAVSAEVYQAQPRMRWLVHRSLEHGLTEVRLWGGRPESGEEPVCHRLSRAACAFKASALVAASVPVERLAATELFRNGDLVPA